MLNAFSRKVLTRSKISLPKNSQFFVQRTNQGSHQFLSKTRKANRLAKRLSLFSNPYSDYFLQPLVEILRKFIRNENQQTGFNYIESMKLKHFDSMYSNFSSFKGLELQPSLFSDAKKVDLRAFYSNSKKLLILDLDETLVYTSLKCGNKDAIPIRGQIEDQIMFVQKRPFLEEFFKSAAKHFNLAIYSAASEDYVKRVVQIIDPQKKYFRLVVARACCRLVQKKHWLKSLSIFQNLNKKQAIVIENNPHIFFFDSKNCVPIVPFYGDIMDDELLKLSRFLEKIQKKSNFQKVLSKCFLL